MRKHHPDQIGPAVRVFKGYGAVHAAILTANGYAWTQAGDIQEDGLTKEEAIERAAGAQSGWNDSRLYR